MYLILISVFVIWLCNLRWNRRKKVQCCAQFKNDFVTLPFLGHALHLLGNEEAKSKIFQAFGREALKQGGVTSLHSWVLNQFYTVVADPVVAELVLKNCLEKDDSMKLFEKLFHDGLFVVSVPQWRPRRKLLNRLFGIKHLRKYVEIFQRKSSILAEKLANVADGEVFSIYNYMSRYSFDVVCESTFGTESNAQQKSENKVIMAFERSNSLMAGRMTQVLFHNESIYRITPMYEELKQVANVIWDFVDKNIRTKFQEYKTNKVSTLDEIKNSSPKSLAQLMIEVSEEELTQDYISQEAMVIVFAGTDATSVALSFTCLLLAKYPDVQVKVYQELQDVFGDYKKPIQSEDLPKLKYTEVVLKESMRLYPPAFLLLRKLDKDLVLPSGQTLIKGTGAMINVWALHRNPEYWGEDAEQFRPERFLEVPPQHPAAYIPFSFGLRNCIGYQFAMMLMKTNLATLVRKYRFLPSARLHSDNRDKNENMRTNFDILYKDFDNFPLRLQTR